jgi:dihydroorotate dehydrogenase (NAD+) catalytic subunit
MGLSLKIKKILFRNPVMVASGTFGMTDEYAPFLDYEKLGGIITKTITLKPRGGNPMPRICETAAGMLNAIGLQNKGIDHFLGEVIPYFRGIRTPLIASIAGETEEEYCELARRLDGEKTVKALEINLSCPNVKKGCLDFQSNPASTRRLLENIRKVTQKLIFTKLSPEAGDAFLGVAENALAGGSDGLSIINTLKGMAVDLKTRRPRLANITGGLSGPAIKPIALRYVHEAKKHFPKTPVIAMGGIMTAKDALEFILVGAELIAVGTANFVNPAASIEIVKGIGRFLREEKTTLTEFRGSLAGQNGGEKC